MDPNREEHEAERLLPRAVFDYYAGAAGDERSMHHNIRAFRQIHFVPRCLRPVPSVDTSLHLKTIGRLSSPILIAPMAMQKLAHPDGELAVARAAAHHSIPYILSTYATTSIEQLASIDTPRLFQLYLYRKREISQRLLYRAHQAGFCAVVLTIDASRFGRRQRDLSNHFHLPPHLSLANFSNGKQQPDKSDASALHSFNDLIENTLSPDAVKWIVSHSRLPVWVKGVLHPEDAIAAIDAGASAIVVSNHGARQVEGVIPSLHALPSITRAVQGRVPVLLDSGIRSGEDVVRAIAMGADAVLLGRPVLWSLAKGGQQAVQKLLKSYQESMELTMALCGASTLSELSKDLIVVDSDLPSKL